MHLIDHVGSAAALATLAALPPRRWLSFVAASTLIDLDHFPDAARRYGIRNPLAGALYALTGQVPGWPLGDPRYPLTVDRPLHRLSVVAGLALLALLSRRVRPVALGLLWHLALDLADILNDREPGRAAAASRSNPTPAG